MAEGEAQAAGAGRESPADEMRVRIHRHLRRYPRLTVREIAGGLKVSETTVRRLLPRMEADGEAAPVTTPKTAETSRRVTRWTAT